MGRIGRLLQEVSDQEEADARERKIRNLMKVRILLALFPPREGKRGLVFMCLSL